jgi:type II secretory pathway component PulF
MILARFAPISRTSQTSKRAALMVFYRGVATLFGAGIHISRALQLMSYQSENQAVRDALIRANRALDAGKPLSSALGESPGVFSRLDVALIRVGEQSGALHRVFERLARYHENSSATLQKLRSALVSPALVLGSCLALLIVVPAFAFKGLFAFLADMHAVLPLSTRILIGVLNVLGSPALILIVAVGVVLARWGWKTLKGSERGRRACELRIQNLPGLGPMLRVAVVAELARSMAVMYGAGVPMLRALELSADLTPSLLIRDALLGAKIAVADGVPLYRALRSTGYFPPVMIHLLQAGEQTGKVPAMLEKAANYMADTVEIAITTALATLEPLALSMVGLLVAFMVLSIMTPLIQVVQSL